MKVNFKNFKDLREQLFNRELWDGERFVVLNNEAGTGKSVAAHKFIGEMAADGKYKVLYVQRFLKDNELNNTVDAINKYAGQDVAVSFTGKDGKNQKGRAKFINSSVVCVTHKMYSQFCKDQHKDILQSRDILVIDEYPDLLEKESVSLAELGTLWAHYPRFEDVWKGFRDMLLDNKNRNKGITTGEEMVYCSFQDPEFCGFSSKLRSLIKNDKKNKHTDILRKLLQILNNGSLLFEDGLHTYNGDIKLKMLKNNIILDANAGFDYRYRMSEIFRVMNQEKTFDYTSSQLIHFDLNTTKQELKKYINLQKKLFEQNVIEEGRSILIVTDKDSVKEWQDAIDEIKTTLGYHICIVVDYFGNLIGVNKYREFDTVVLAKTPNYDYLTYALTYLFYQSKNNLPIDSHIKLFDHKEIEEIRRTTVAGEMYQAIKRINRDNSRSAKMYVITDYQEAMNMVINELHNIQNIKNLLKVDKKRGGKEKLPKEQNKKDIAFQKLILECIRDRVISIEKQEIRDKIKENDKGNFSRLLKRNQHFLKQHHIELNNNKSLIFSQVS